VPPPGPARGLGTIEREVEIAETHQRRGVPGTSSARGKQAIERAFEVAPRLEHDAEVVRPSMVGGIRRRAGAERGFRRVVELVGEVELAERADRPGDLTRRCTARRQRDGLGVKRLDALARRLTHSLEDRQVGHCDRPLLRACRRGQSC
jgi:hypothetical protein